MKNFIEKIFYFQNQLQLKHWQESSGYLHEIEGKYYSALTAHFDTLVECYLSVFKDVTITETAFIIINHIDVATFDSEIRKFINELREEFDSKQIHSLVNILDDIATTIEQYNYLLQKQ